MKYSLLFLCIFLSLNTFAQKKLTVSGYITDEKSSETLIGATVFDQNSKHGAITNVFGFYSLTLPEGACSLKFSYVGYTPQTLDFFLSKDTLVNIRLSEEAALEEIVVTAQKDDAGITSTKMGSLDVPVKIIEHTPAILGETDVMKTIQLMPGVQQGTAGSSAIYVRGGGGDAAGHSRRAGGHGQGRGRIHDGLHIRGHVRQVLELQPVPGAHRHRKVQNRAPHCHRHHRRGHQGI